MAMENPTGSTKPTMTKKIVKEKLNRLAAAKRYKANWHPYPAAKNCMPRLRVLLQFWLVALMLDILFITWLPSPFLTWDPEVIYILAPVKLMLATYVFVLCYRIDRVLMMRSIPVELPDTINMCGDLYVTLVTASYKLLFASEACYPFLPETRQQTLCRMLDIPPDVADFILQDIEKIYGDTDA